MKKQFMIRVMISLAGVLWMADVLLSEVSQNSELSQKMNEQTLEQWQNTLYFIWAHPTEMEVRARLAKDPKWAMFISQQSGHMAISKGISSPYTPTPGEAPEKPAKKSWTLPKGVYAAVRVPEGQTLPAPSVSTPDQGAALSQGFMVLPGGAAGTAAVTQEPAGEIEQSLLAGAWTGQYFKLIEYYNPRDGQWNASENSLRDVPVELDLDPNGNLVYKMPERDGTATYVLKDGVFSIICQDVRVQGDYEIERRDQNRLVLKTSREIVENKIRVSIEFRLTKK